MRPLNLLPSSILLIKKPVATQSKRFYTYPMNDAEVVDLIREAIWLCIKMSTPIMLIGLVVGVAIALLQALTQIQEVTLVFVPKILAIFLALFVAMPMFSIILGDFMQVIADKIVAIK